MAFKSNAQRKAAFANMGKRVSNISNTNYRQFEPMKEMPSHKIKVETDDGLDEIKKLRTETGLFKSTADAPLFDSIFKRPDYYKNEKGLTAKLEYMSPMDYLNESVRGYDNVTLEEHITDMKKYRSTDYAKSFKEGDLFPIPWFEYYEDGSKDQEGNHRAMALQLLIDEGHIKTDYKMPVIIIQHQR